MAVADEGEGWAEAQRRITACREKRSESLDLQNLGLTRVPKALLELGWLHQLNLHGNFIGAEGAWALSALVNLTRLYLGRNGIGAEGARALSGLSKLTWLDLKGNHIGAQGARALSPLVNLTGLHLGGNGIGAGGARALSKLSDLTWLDLSGNGIGAEGARVLSDLVNLTSLYLGGNGIDANGVQALSRLSNLIWLDLTGNRIGAAGARALSGLVKLTGLQVSGNSIGAEGASALSGLISLTSLDLRGNRIGAEGARALSGLINLTSLQLTGNDIGVEGARTLSALINLSSLDLGGNRIGADGARVLSDLVKLTWLDLGKNGIGADGAQALSGLVNLTWLDLEYNNIGAEGARALSSLVNLTWLDLRSNSIGAKGAQALSGLANLTRVDLRGNGIGPEGARALSGLSNLAWLDLRGNNVGAEGARALSSLSNLTSLYLGGNGIGAAGAQSLSSLLKLSSLDLEHNFIGSQGAQALSGLANLTWLNLGHNRICAEGAQALSRLLGLTWLDLRGNRIGPEGARSLSVLVNLTALHVGGNGIADEGACALSSLTNLTSLNLAYNGVTDLYPLLQLQNLKKLDCSGCALERAPPELWATPSIESVILHEGSLSGVPKEVLSETAHASCLKRLRAHFADLEVGATEMTDFKLMILGNGRVGKTQICRQLRGKEYDEAVPSTHGVEVSAAQLTTPQGAVTLRIWDFGGQDIYHSTHALFLKSRAIFLLTWTPESEAVHYHEHGGFAFRNQPLGYWLAYVRAFGSKDSPVLVVQTQCDLPEQELLRLPLADEAFDGFPFKKVLHYSAKENRGRAAFDEALADAVQWLKRRHGVAVIGAGRAAVKARLERMYYDGKKFISQAEFFTLCKKTEKVSSPSLLLDYLHNIGSVFYRKGLFGDAIILDQAWVLEAVYAVFDRDSRAFKNIQRYGGRFRRSDLSEWIWREHSAAEQKLLLSFMRQCGICFTFQRGTEYLETEYIAPDFLPERNDRVIVAQIRQKWDQQCDAVANIDYDLLPSGLMRALISHIGEQAGLHGEYWRDGFFFYDQETDSRALVEQRYTKDWAGEIHIQTQRGQAQLLLERVLKLIDERHGLIGARPKDRAIKTHETGSDSQEDSAAIKPGPEPSSKTEYYVSHAWGDESSDEARERDDIVAELCEDTQKKNIVSVIRTSDKTAARCGDRISQFLSRMRRLDRIYIVLSDRYLNSACFMIELYYVWRHCREHDAECMARTRAYTLPCAEIATASERAHYDDIWRKRFEERRTRIEKKGQLVLSDEENAEYELMKRFVNDTRSMLRFVHDVLRPRTFFEFKTYGFADPPPPEAAAKVATDLKAEMSRIKDMAIKSGVADLDKPLYELRKTILQYPGRVPREIDNAVDTAIWRAQSLATRRVSDPSWDYFDEAGKIVKEILALVDVVSAKLKPEP